MFTILWTDDRSTAALFRTAIRKRRFGSDTSAAPSLGPKRPADERRSSNTADILRRASAQFTKTPSVDDVPSLQLLLLAQEGSEVS